MQHACAPKNRRGRGCECVSPPRRDGFQPGCRADPGASPYRGSGLPRPPEDGLSLESDVKPKLACCLVPRSHRLGLIEDGIPSTPIKEHRGPLT